MILQNIRIANGIDIAKKTGKIKLPCRLNLSLEEIKDFSLIISNDDGEELVIGYDKKQNQYFIDRSKSGKTDFHKEFAAKHVAPRLTDKTKMNMSLVIDVSSVELFADDGLTVMTSIFFPNNPYNQIHIQSDGGILLKKLEFIGLKSIWK